MSGNRTPLSRERDLQQLLGPEHTHQETQQHSSEGCVKPHETHYTRNPKVFVMDAASPVLTNTAVCTLQTEQEGFLSVCWLTLASRLVGRCHAAPHFSGLAALLQGAGPSLQKWTVSKENSSAQSLCYPTWIKCSVWLTTPYTLNLVSLWEMGSWNSCWAWREEKGLSVALHTFSCKGTEKIQIKESHYKTEYGRYSQEFSNN